MGIFKTRYCPVTCVWGEHSDEKKKKLSAEKKGSGSIGQGFVLVSCNGFFLCFVHSEKSLTARVLIYVYNMWHGCCTVLLLIHICIYCDSAASGSQVRLL